MFYKFYCYEALIKEDVKKLFQSRFAISANTYDRIITENANMDLLFGMMTKRNMYDVCHNLNSVKDDIPDELKIAIEYENGYHPDEVIFVTTNKEMAIVANKYFGSDSIKLMK